MIIDASTDSIRVADLDRAQWVSRNVEFLDYSVSLIGDCFQRIGMLDPGIRPLTAERAMVGPILPVLCREGDNLAIHRALDVAEAGDVLVINALGDVRRAVFGSIIAEACAAIGLAGVVIDGSVRDVRELQDLGVPVFARGVSPAGPYKTGPGTVGEPVACGGVVCYPGELIVGDDDGLIVLNSERVSALPELIAKQRQVEAKMRARIRTELTPDSLGRPAITPDRWAARI